MECDSQNDYEDSARSCKDKPGTLGRSRDCPHAYQLSNLGTNPALVKDCVCGRRLGGYLYSHFRGEIVLSENLGFEKAIKV